MAGVVWCGTVCVMCGCVYEWVSVRCAFCVLRDVVVPLPRSFGSMKSAGLTAKSGDEMEEKADVSCFQSRASTLAGAGPRADGSIAVTAAWKVVLAVRARAVEGQVCGCGRAGRMSRQANKLAT